MEMGKDSYVFPFTLLPHAVRNTESSAMVATAGMDLTCMPASGNPNAELMGRDAGTLQSRNAAGKSVFKLSLRRLKGRRWRGQFHRCVEGRRSTDRDGAPG